jgi:Cu+-exporting ATPase
VVFDKTGTLTSGTPKIAHLAAVDGNESRVLQQAGALQRGSEHPLAKAVLDACAERGLTVADVSASQSLTGRGIAGTLDGRRWPWATAVCWKKAA